MEYINIQTQVLVAGAGGAGIRAAIEASLNGADTILMTEGKLFGEGSTFYEKSPPWGFMAANNESDMELFYEDIIKSGKGCLSPGLAKILSRESIAAFSDLQSYGLSFTKLSDLHLKACFGKNQRGAMLDDLEGAEKAFYDKLASFPNLKIMEEITITNLAVREKECIGAIGFTGSGKMIAISAGAVVLACGGAQNLYKYAYRNGALNGSAYAMAARYGARVVNLEFVQFINATLEPVKGLNYYQFAFVTQPEVTNGNGEKFLYRHIPEHLSEKELMDLRSTHGPFSVEDDAKYFDLAIVEESLECGKAGAKIRMDPERINGERYRPWRECLARECLKAEEPITIYPHCHAFNGGVFMHDNIETDIRGLFVCGEAAGGCHGANRIGGCSMLATQVFGKLSGRCAAKYAGRNPGKISPELAVRILEQECAACGENAETPERVMRGIQEIMQTEGFLKRCHTGLEGGLSRLGRLNGTFNPMAYLNTKRAGEAFSAFNALCSARLILTAMRERRESRGGHFRTDYPEEDPEFASLIAVKICDNEIVHECIHESK